MKAKVQVTKTSPQSTLIFQERLTPKIPTTRNNFTLDFMEFIGKQHLFLYHSLGRIFTVLTQTTTQLQNTLQLICMGQGSPLKLQILENNKAQT